MVEELKKYKQVLKREKEEFQEAMRAEYVLLCLLN